MKWINWKIKRFFARWRMEDYFECGMGYTPNCITAMGYVRTVEDWGISKGWMTEEQRTVKVDK